MSEAKLRNFDLPSNIENMIASILAAKFNLKLTDSQKLAACIQQMSDFYIAHPGEPTPWHERWCQIAQLAYYFPLNFLRMQAALQEGQRFQFLNQIDHVVDFGSGLGTTGFALQSLGWKKNLTVIEKSNEATKLSRELGLSFELASRAVAHPHSMLTFSYSFAELSSLPNWVFDFDFVLFVEPATRTEGRKLLQIRKELLAKGASIWAPCPHQGPCPLFEKSPSDWCHDRIHFNRPLWWQKVEEHLPFHNQTLTFSYLLASKQPSPLPEGKIRLVGDLMKEKGKSRQMICRGSDREFISWLSRQGEIPEVPRGVLIQPIENFQLAGTEIRPQEPLRILKN